MKKILLSVAVIFAFGANDDMDALFDEGFSQSKTETSADVNDEFDNFFEKDIPVKKKKSYKTTFKGMFKVRGYRFIEPTHYTKQDNALYHSDSILQLDGKFKKDNYIISSSFFGMIGTDDYTYNYKEMYHEFRDVNKETPMGGIRELYTIRSSDSYDIIVGKKIFNTGISTIYSPSDVYNVKVSPDPLDPYTIGTWLVDLEYYYNDSNIGLVFFPFISNSKTAAPESRWSGNSDEQANIDSFIIPAGSEIIEDTENRVRALARFKTNILVLNQGVDLMLDVGYGPSLYTVLEYTDKPNVYLQTRPSAWYVSGGFSTTYKKLEVHGEFYYQNAFSDADDDFVSAVGGATYTLDKFVDKVGFNKIDMTIEYVREIIIDTYDDTVTYRSSEQQRAPKNDILINVSAEINDKWSLGYFGNFRLELNQQKDSGRYQKVSTTYKMYDGLVMNIFGEMFNGDVNSYYGKWKRNDRVGVDFKYSF